MNYLHHTLPLLGAAALLAALPDPAPAEPAHGIAMIGDPALPAGFDHLPYVNPDASRGGRVTYGVIGSFDSLNPMIVQGGLTSARGLSTDTLVGNLVFESLLMRSSDEPFTLYGFIAETVETPPDRSWVEFTLNPKAHFSDGMPVTVDDVVFSLELLRDKGRPNYRSYYSKVERIERVGERGVRFHIANAHDRELPLILGLMPVLPKHAIKAETFDKSTLVPMVGTGPYLLAEVSPPNYVVYKRNPDYWAKDLPIKRGLDNFDEIRFEYYRDDNSLFEAFKKGLYQINPEGDPARWNTAYDFPAIKDGRVVMESFRTGAPKGMSGFAFNTRRPVFANVGVRKALATLLDFDWINENLYHRAFVRAGGYFNDSELSSIGRPADEKERKLLAPFPDAVAPEVMDGTYKPVSASGRDERKVLRDALAVLKEAGYELRGDALVETATNKPLTFEIMVTTKEDERLALAYQRTLDRIGIKISIRSVDSAQYQQRRTTFDFDVIRNTWPVSLSPGNEQNFRWSQQAADTDGSFNFPGAKEPAIDAMIQALLEASTREDFVAAIRALDRVLISGYYAVPLFYLPEQWLAHWRSVERPQTTPVTGYNLPTWWAKQN
jgi:peptide/nickel transport system substrate-binding protein